MIDPNYKQKKEKEKREKKRKLLILNNRRSEIKKEEQDKSDAMSNWEFNYYRRCYEELHDRVPYNVYKRIQKYNRAINHSKKIENTKNSEIERYRLKKETISIISKKIEDVKSDRKYTIYRILSAIFVLVAPYTALSYDQLVIFVIAFSVSIGLLFDEVLPNKKKKRLSQLYKDLDNEYEFNLEHSFLGVEPRDYVGYKDLLKTKQYDFFFSEPTTVYYLLITCDGRVAYKIGITNQSIKERFGGDYYNIEILMTMLCKSRIEAYSIEQEILRKYRYLKYLGEDLLRNGNTELFHSDIRNEIGEDECFLYSA